tara:strand:- start:29 stop:661 length:633 start_codon:yes stop_codon:yes gene_type:complete
LVDEVTYLVNLLEDNWDAAITALKTTGGDATIADIHGVHPVIMDIRDMSAGKKVDAQGRPRGGNKVQSRWKNETVISPSTVSYSSDIIVVMETGQTLDYPTVAWDIREEVYNMNVSIRTRQDDRTLNSGTRLSHTTTSGSETFGRDRIQSLYLVVQYVLEQKRRGWLVSGVLQENFSHIMLGERAESNDKRNKIFGYKVNVMMKRYAQAV